MNLSSNGSILGNLQDPAEIKICRLRQYCEIYGIYVRKRSLICNTI